MTPEDEEFEAIAKRQAKEQAERPSGFMDSKLNPIKREWVGLTDDEIDLLEELYAPPVHPDFVNDASHCLELIRHVEAKLKEKNGC